MIGLFNQTATISRFSEGSRGAFGEPARTWATLSTVACRIEGVSGAERTRPQIVDATHNAFFAPGVDITEKDRITADSRTYDVVFVNRLPGGFANHIEVECREVRT